jgi:tetratricopeptide (TPR) repeat protein
MARRLVEQDPDANFVNAYLSWVLEKQGKHDEALEYARKEPVDFVRMNAIGFVHFKMGNDDAAIAIQEELEAQYGDSAAYQQASISSASGYAELTLSWLERAYEARDPGMTAIKTDPDFEFLHDNPRFIRLLEKMNLAD